MLGEPKKIWEDTFKLSDAIKKGLTMTKLSEELKAMFTDHYSNECMMYDGPSYGGELRSVGVKASSVEHYGGEDQGSTYYTIWKFERGDEACYFQFDGWYASYNGAEFDSVFEVFPKEVTKVEFSR